MAEVPPHDADAAELVLRARSGQRKAMEALLLRGLPELRDYVQQHMSPTLRAREASEDLVQSTCRGWPPSCSAAPTSTATA